MVTDVWLSLESLGPFTFSSCRGTGWLGHAGCGGCWGALIPLLLPRLGSRWKLPPCTGSSRTGGPPGHLSSQVGMPVPGHRCPLIQDSKGGAKPDLACAAPLDHTAVPSNPGNSYWVQKPPWAESHSGHTKTHWCQAEIPAPHLHQTLGTISPEIPRGQDLDCTAGSTPTPPGQSCLPRLRGPGLYM